MPPSQNVFTSCIRHELTNLLEHQTHHTKLPPPGWLSNCEPVGSALLDFFPRERHELSAIRPPAFNVNPNANPRVRQGGMSTSTGSKVKPSYRTRLSSCGVRAQSSWRDHRRRAGENLKVLIGHPLLFVRLQVLLKIAMELDRPPLMNAPVEVLTAVNRKFQSRSALITLGKAQKKSNTSKSPLTRGQSRALGLSWGDLRSNACLSTLRGKTDRG